MKRFWIVSTLLITVLLLTGATVLALKPKQDKPTVYITPSPPTVQELILAVNNERAKVGAPPLGLDARLNDIAQSRSDDMIARGYFSHFDPITNENLVKPVSYCTHYSENIVTSLDTELAISWWLSSAPHYTAMIDTKYDITGFGITRHDNDYYVVEHFCVLK